MRVQALNAFNLRTKNFVFKGNDKNKEESWENYNFNHQKSIEAIGNYAIANYEIAKAAAKARALNSKKALQERIEEEQQNLPVKYEEIKENARKISVSSDKYYRKAQENFTSAYKLYQNIKKMSSSDENNEWFEENEYEVCREYDENNNLTRQITFKQGIPSKITVINPDATQDCFVYDISFFEGKGELSSDLNVKILTNLQQGETTKADFVFEFQDGKLIEASKDVENSNNETSKKEIYLFDDYLWGNQLSHYAEGLKGTFCENDFNTKEESDTLERLYCFQGTFSILTNAQFGGGNIKDACNADEMFVFDECNKIKYAQKCFADGVYEKWGKWF